MALFSVPNLPTVLVCLALLLLVVFVLFRMISDRKKGKGTCSCQCAGCAFRDRCHTKK